MRGEASEQIQISLNMILMYNKSHKLGFAGERRTKNHSMCVGESTMFQFGERHPVLFEIVLVRKTSGLV